MRRPSLANAVTGAVVAACAVFILLQLQPGLLVADTLAAGGDMGAHVWGPAYLRDHVLPDGRITGWTPDWYAGFPAYFFYFPLPNLLIVALDLVLPYAVAFKLVTVSGLVALPVAASVLGRLLRLPSPTPALFAVATVPFVFDRFHTIWGGNAAATLAGEYSFSIALAVALVFIGVLYRALDTGSGRALAAALLAATALCHLLPAAFAVLAAGILVLLRRPDAVRWRLVVTVGAVAFALASFWFLPFIVRHVQGYSNDMGWERTQAYVDNLLPWLRTDDAAPAAATRHLKLVMPLAALGAFVGAVRKRRGAIALALLAAASAAAFVLIPNGAIWNARFLPFWYLTVYLLAASAVGEAAAWGGSAFASWLARRTGTPADHPDARVDAEGFEHPRPLGARPPVNVTALVVPVAALLAVLVATGKPLGVFDGRIELPGEASLPFVTLAGDETNFVPAWARWNYSGYERKPAYAEYREVVQTMARVGRDRGCGRAMWEYEPELNRYGTPMALMLLPYWTDSCIGSMEGLFFESSATVPYHFLNQSELSRTPSRAMRSLPYRDLDVDAGVEHLQLMGVRYFMAIHPETQAQAAANPDLELVATTTSYPVDYNGTPQQRFWQVFEVKDAPLVAPLDHRPAVVQEDATGQDRWLELSVDWYQDATRWDVPLAPAGPDEWPRIASAADARDATALPREPVDGARVTDVDVDHDRISFRVDEPGTPVVVRMSYFPNWKVRGADGPWRVTPNFMVVVPTEEEVVLQYGWTGVDVAGWFLTVMGALALVGLARAGAVGFPAVRRRVRGDHFVDPFLPDRDEAEPFDLAGTGARAP